MVSFVQSGNCGVINTSDTTTNGFYVIQLISEAYKLQNNTTIYGEIISAGELVLRKNVYAPCKKILAGIGNNSHCNIISWFEHAPFFFHILMLSE